MAVHDTQAVDEIEIHAFLVILAGVAMKEYWYRHLASLVPVKRIIVCDDSPCRLSVQF